MGSIRAIWALQDKIALDAQEEKTLGVKREITNGMERVVWNPTISISVREFELTDTEVSRLRAALTTWDSYATGADRRWLEPLLDTLFSATVAVDSRDGGICARPIAT
ncbi:MAG: hypothetical protein M1570_12450 [Chloroflexi bacterium]|nr:hypothetical protein [Chloroflexota bacterium]